MYIPSRSFYRTHVPKFPDLILLHFKKYFKEFVEHLFFYFFLILYIQFKIGNLTRSEGFVRELGHLFIRGVTMRYIFENENALELYYHITKEMNVKLVPEGFEDEVYISAKNL